MPVVNMFFRIEEPLRAHQTGVDLTPESVTQLLNAWGSGNEAAGNQLIAIVYKELRRLAAHYLKVERPDHTLQPTALVHELYIKFFSAEPIEWRDRGHFLAVAARQLRHIVIDYARVQHAQKRGGVQQKLSLDDLANVGVVIDGRILEVDQALTRLSELDERAAQVVELRYFGGLTESEVAQALSISVATVKRDWEFARSWLFNEIE
jgi:RNA polymerase sigma factor (TIGR02999 family)